MKKIWIMFLMSLINNIACAQFNLASNPSFEDTIFGTPCYCSDAIELCVENWFNPHGATPDYYTYFPGYCSGTSSLNNGNGFQLARTGNAYAGIYGLLFPTREYIAIRLSDTLLQNECYYAELYVSLANLARYGIDNLGCYFTNDTSGYKSITTNIPVVPQVLNQPGNFLSDTMNWQKVSGSFTATGGETFLIIGNFFNDANTALDTVNTGSTWQAAYYYIDDVLVTPCDSLTGIENIAPIGNVRVYPVPATNTLKVLTNQKRQHCKLKLYEVSGVEMTPEILIKNQSYGWELDISNLSSGVYLLILTDGSAVNYQFKVIKQ